MKKNIDFEPTAEQASNDLFLLSLAIEKEGAVHKYPKFQDIQLEFHTATLSHLLTRGRVEVVKRLVESDLIATARAAIIIKGDNPLIFKYDYRQAPNHSLVSERISYDPTLSGLTALSLYHEATRGLKIPKRALAVFAHAGVEYKPKA